MTPSYHPQPSSTCQQLLSTHYIVVCDDQTLIFIFIDFFIFLQITNSSIETIYSIVY